MSRLSFSSWRLLLGRLDSCINERLCNALATDAAVVRLAVLGTISASVELMAPSTPGTYYYGA